MFRLWVSVGVGLFVGLVFEIIVIALQVTGTRPTPTEAQFELEFLFGARLTAWNAFAIAYLVLGLRAFSRCDRAELVRRVLAKPLPASPVKRWLLAGGGGPGWPVVIALVAFVTIVTAVLSRDDATDLVLALAAGTVVTCWMVITFSFALQYARRDIEQGGLEISRLGRARVLGLRLPRDRVFSDLWHHRYDHRQQPYAQAHQRA